MINRFCTSSMPFAVALFSLLCFISSPSIYALDWRDESFPHDHWATGVTPIGFGPDVVTVVESGHITYYFRILVSIPDETDIPIDRLYLTFYSLDGVAVYFHSTEIGRSPSLPPGDLDASRRAAYHHTSGVQTFDASAVLNECRNGIDGNFRSIAVEVHRVDPFETSFRFDAVGIAMSEGAELTLLPTGETWSFDDSGQRPAPIPIQPVRSIVIPVRGMPVVTEPGQGIEIMANSGLFPETLPCVLESRFAATALTLTKSGVDPRNLDVFSVVLPSGLCPGVYDLHLLDDDLPETVPGGIVLLEDVSAGNLSILHMTDSHIPFRGEWAPDNSGEFQNVLDAANIMNPDLIIHTGDGYTEGDSGDQAERFADMILGATSGFCYTPGNHELGEWCGSGDGRRNMWTYFGWSQLDPSQPGHWPESTRDWVFDLGPISFLFMESWVHYSDCWDGFFPDTSFTSEQIAWLRYQAQIREDQPTVVLAYHHDFNDEFGPLLPGLGVDLTLSGHTHQSSVDTTGGVLYLKTAATYGSDRPLRWLRFENGRLTQYPTIRETAISTEETPPSNGREDTVTILVRNRESSPLTGLKHWIQMRPSIDYRADLAQIIDQRDLPGGRLVGIEYDLEPGESRQITIEPQESPSNLQVWLDSTRPVFHAGDPAGIAMNIVARWFPVDLELYVVIEADGQFYFWPDWSPEPDSVTFRLPVGDYLGLDLFNFNWPDLPLFGKQIRIHAAALDPRSGILLRPVASIEVIY